MKHLKKYNESNEEKKTLRDLIGDIKSVKKVGYRTIYETTKGCLTNLDIKGSLDDEYRLYMYKDNDSPTGYGNVGEISIPRKLHGYICFIDGDARIISYGPGDERGCTLFSDVFIASGHDGSFLWNVKTGEFEAHTW